MNLSIKEMLLIDEPTVLILKDELLKVSGWFVLPVFLLALCLEYFGELKFYEVVKKLILVIVFMGAFYNVHKEGVDLSFKASEEILKKVSPRNIFLRKWTEVKVKTKESSTSGWIDKFAIPNINDFIGTAFFLLSKVFIWILKLIYSTVYHLTYIFAPLTAVLYFFPVTKGSISGTIQSSLWCMVMPIVLVSILAIVGNSIQVPANEGNLSIISIDQIIWLFGVTLLLLMSPILTLGILRGGGVAMSGSAIGVMMTGAGMKLITAIPHAKSLVQSGINKFKTPPSNLSQFRNGKNISPPSKSFFGNSNSHHKLSHSLRSQKTNGDGTNNFHEKQSIDSSGGSTQGVNSFKPKDSEMTKLSQSNSSFNNNQSSIKEVQHQNNSKKMETSTIRNNQINSAKSMEFKGQNSIPKSSITKPKIETRFNDKVMRPSGLIGVKK